MKIYINKLCKKKKKSAFAPAQGAVNISLTLRPLKKFIFKQFKISCNFSILSILRLLSMH